MAETFRFIPAGAQGAAVASALSLGTAAAGTLTYETQELIPQPPSAVRVVATAYRLLNVPVPTVQALSGVTIETEVPPLPTDPAVYNSFIELSQAGVASPGVPRFTDVAVTKAGALRFRDYNTLRFTSPDGLVGAGDFIRVVYRNLAPGSATGLWVQVYVKSRRYQTVSPDYDSGAGALRGNTAVTGLDHVHVGMSQASAQPYDLFVGAIIGNNDGSDPGPGYGSIPAAPAVTGVAGNGTAAVSWTAPGQAHVLVYRRTGADPYALVTTQPADTATSYTETGLTNGQPVGYAVRVSGASGGWSTAGYVTITPSATSSQVMLPDGDVKVAGCSAVNPPAETFASCLLVDTDESYVKIADGGELVVSLSDPSLPLPANSTARGDYDLGPDVNAQMQARFVLPDGTVVLADDVKTGPGSYSLIADSVTLSGLTDAQIRSLDFSVINLGPLTADVTG